MWKYVLFGSAAVLLCTAMQAHAVSLPDDQIDRAIACSVYGGFAPNSDPGTVPAKRVIDHTIKEAVATGRRTQQQVNDAFYDTATQAMNDEPREELIADWRECRNSFAPPDFNRPS
jgi:hypothetical protein